MNIICTSTTSLGPLADRVYWTLRRGIESGERSPGARMPTEAALCAEFDASRNTVRKALSRLEQERRVVRKTHGGIYVAPPPPTDSTTVSLMYHGDIDTLTVVQNLLLERGCVMSLFSQREQGWSTEFEAKFLTQVLRQRHRALLASCTPTTPRNDALLAQLAEAGVRVIHIEPYEAERLPRQHYLMPDYRQAGRAMATALMIAGYRTTLFAELDGCLSPFHTLSRAGAFDTCREQRGEARSINAEELADPAAIAKHVAAAGGSLGIVCSTACAAAKIRLAARQAGLDIPARLGLISLALAGDPPEHLEELSTVSFDRMAIFRRAVALACDDTFDGITELVAPTIVEAESVRKAGT